MATTGEICTKNGRYTGRCPRGHQEFARFYAGDVFIPCSTGVCSAETHGYVKGSPMTWTWLGT